MNLSDFRLSVTSDSNFTRMCVIGFFCFQASVSERQETVI